MADKAPSSLTAAGALDGTEILHVVKAGNSRRATAQAIASLAGFSLVDSWTHSVDVANVDFTDLGDYNELLVKLRAVTLSVSGQRVLRVSTDNGSSFYSASGDYDWYDNLGVETAGAWVALHGSATTAARTCIAQILGSNINGTQKDILMAHRDLNYTFDGSTSPINALRILPSAGGNLTGGSMYIFGR